MTSNVMVENPGHVPLDQIEFNVKKHMEECYEVPCSVTPTEHLGLPNAEDFRDCLIAYKISVQATDIARHRPGVHDRV